MHWQHNLSWYMHFFYDQADKGDYTKKYILI